MTCAVTNVLLLLKLTIYFNCNNWMVIITMTKLFHWVLFASIRAILSICMLRYVCFFLRSIKQTLKFSFFFSFFWIPFSRRKKVSIVEKAILRRMFLGDYGGLPIERRSGIQEATCQNEFTFDSYTLYMRLVHTMQSIGSCRLPLPLSDCSTSVWRPPLRFISTKFRRIRV